MATEGQPQPQPQDASKAVVKPVEAPVPAPSYGHLLDESGFFQKGKIHEKVMRELTCHCMNCSSKALWTIYNGGVQEGNSMIATYKRYEGLVGKIHRAKLEIPPLNDEKTIFEQNKQR